MLIVLEGIDGAGKTTLAAGLRERLAHAGDGEVELWRKKDYAFAAPPVRERLHRLHDLIWGDPAHAPEPDEDVLGTQHYLFLHAAWFAALTTLRVRPMRAQPGRGAVVDGWYYRSVAKAVLRGGVGERWATSLFEDDDGPDLVVLLDVDPEVAWQRRGGQFSASELGRWDGHTGDAAASFRAYQSAVGSLLRDMGERGGWCVVRPDPSWSPDRVLEHVHAQVARRLVEVVAMT